MCLYAVHNDRTDSRYCVVFQLRHLKGKSPFPVLLPEGYRQALYCYSCLYYTISEDNCSLFIDLKFKCKLLNLPAECNVLEVNNIAGV